MPTYLWGASGSGKTHLLKAVRESLREQGASVPAQIVPALALKEQILLAFNRHCEGWNLNPSERAAFAASSY